MQPLTGSERARFSASDDLHGLELLSARFVEHRFAPHVHDGHVIAVLEAGAERYRYRGVDHLAGAGSIALLNPDEVHTGSKGVEQGWQYRVFYPQPGTFEALLAELAAQHVADPVGDHDILVVLSVGRRHLCLDGSLVVKQAFVRLNEIQFAPRRNPLEPLDGSPERGEEQIDIAYTAA